MRCINLRWEHKSAFLKDLIRNFMDHLGQVEHYPLRNYTTLDIMRILMKMYAFITLHRTKFFLKVSLVCTTTLFIQLSQVISVTLFKDQEFFH
jgi:predicted DNA-binding protein (MmcQ/YjbR family)